MRERGQEVDLFDPFGQVIRWTPEFHVSLFNPRWFFMFVQFRSQVS